MCPYKADIFYNDGNQRWPPPLDKVYYGMLSKKNVFKISLNLLKRNMTGVFLRWPS
jgi:hypothetical protein